MVWYGFFPDVASRFSGKGCPSSEDKWGSQLNLCLWPRSLRGRMAGGDVGTFSSIGAITRRGDFAAGNRCDRRVTPPLSEQLPNVVKEFLRVSL